MRLLPSPGLVAYESCFRGTLAVNSTFNWSVPGAMLEAQAMCWCAHNMTATIEAFGCCDHRDFYPMCLVNCTPDCGSELAQQCVSECPAMCQEVHEYALDADLCRECDWIKCWPVLRCINEHATEEVEAGELEEVCHEVELMNGPELKGYWECWRDAPKHSSHWNILSSAMHCTCREGMIGLLRNASCCGSASYDGGACDLECLSEAECHSQDAQTCIHGCQLSCPADEAVPGRACLRDCISLHSGCRRYLTCRPPQGTEHVCDDGRWPQASSGCCHAGDSSTMGCPRGCDSQRIWRLDGGAGTPRWATWNHDRESGIVAQCSCGGCPGLTPGRHRLSMSAEELWDNGQALLVDVARREGRLLGPSRTMQELMAARNREISEILDNADDNDGRVGDIVARVNSLYIERITQAARDDPDEYYAPRGTLHDDMRAESTWVFGILAALCACTVLSTAVIALWCSLRTRRTNVSTFNNESQQVVIGNPVSGVSVNGAVEGVAVRVSAPTKAPKDGKH